jgi:serine/threonine-protein kinase
MSEPTQTLGKYQIIREIARSNDIVYEAYDPLMNRRVALKELAMPTGLNEKQREDRHNRFLREARAAGTLTHPNIVTVYEYGEDSNRHYIAMEFLDGHTLRNELDTHGFLPLDRALEIAKSILAALDYAHKNGVIHRDIKPENVQLMSDGRIKITDFGIARLTFEPNITMDGQVFGTPSYMSPEQVVGKEIDARSDLFSVGVVLFEMVAGRKPFQGDSVVSITYAIMNAEPQQPQQANYAVWQVIQRALDKSPALRFASAAEMTRALDEAEAASFSNSPVLDPMSASNPYGQVPSLYGQPQPQQQPQFQIGNAPPVGNPYVNTPYQSQPISYPYNPYQTGAPNPAPAPMSSPRYPPFPIYYPPPPGPPLISPEAKSVMGRIFISFVVIGTILILGVIAVQGFSKAFERYQLENQGAGAPVRASRSAPPVTRPEARRQAQPPVAVPPPSVEPEPQYDLAAGRELLNRAIALDEEGRYQEARVALYEARTLLPPDSQEYAEVQQRIESLTDL